MDELGRPRATHGPGVRLAALSLLVTLGLSLAPCSDVRAAESSHPCHGSAPSDIAVTAAQDGGSASHACLTMLGCIAVAALPEVPQAMSAFTPTVHQILPAAQAVRDLASRGPPTPPPNS